VIGRKAVFENVTTPAGAVMVHKEILMHPA